ncbi:MAG: GNAT family N-acetyltransferase [Ignavibacteriae bacterium]|nr:GNAT family N-acetyltransferase [Ignavibacteriota bacterium]
MGTVVVQPVASKQDIKAFIKFPWRIYANNSPWVPPLLVDRKKLIDKKRNPFYNHAEAEFFLARNDGELVGRIGAIVNHHHNKEHNENIGFFGFFESVNDQTVASTLVETAAQWLKTQGVTAMRGPANPSVNDEWGLLIDAFDKPPYVLMPYNPSYYPELLETAGLRKIKDLYAYHLRKETVFSERLTRVAEMIRQREGLSFRTLDMRNFKSEVKLIKDLYNRAWQYNWGAVPMTDEEFDALAKDLKPVVDPNLVIIAEYKGKPIGFALSLPNFNLVLKHNKSGHFLSGLFWLLWKKKSINQIRIIVLGVVRERQKTGAASVLFYETARRGIECGYTEGEAGWVLEDNVMMNRAAELLNAERYKTYRIYEMPI